MIDGHIITVDDEVGKSQYDTCVRSIVTTGSQVQAVRFRATTPDTLLADAREIDMAHISWNWPQKGDKGVTCLATGLYKNPYAANDVKRVIACAISHVRLWKQCSDTKEAMLILESDAKFIRKFDYDNVKDYKWGALGLNDPRGTTRRSQIFYDKAVANSEPGVYNVPKVDEVGEVRQPQGLAGNSAYLIRPHAAAQLLDAIKHYGLWPNDALMCQEMFPWLKITQPFYTQVQGGASATKG